MEGEKERNVDNVYDDLCQSQDQALQFPPGPPVKLPQLANLVYPPQSRLEEMMSKIPKPDGYLPRMHFPKWVDMPLHQKLPGMPMESFVYSRGKLNQPLRRHFNKVYTTVDPHNAFNFLPSGTYSALHDPATERYFKRPSVRKLLLEQGLVTDQGEVVCTQKEINEYRQYLEHFQTDFLKSDLRFEEEKKQANSSLEKELRTYVGINSDYKIRNELVDERQRLMQEERIRRLKYKMKEDQEIAKRNRDKMKKEWEERRQESKLCAEHQRKQRLALQCKGAGDNLASDEKHARARLLAFIVKMRKELVKTLQESEMVVAKSQFQKQELETRKGIMATLARDRQEKQKEYTKKMELHRSQFPMWAERRKDNERRILQIMRKFLDRWRDYVKRRKAHRSDPNHQSSWDVDGKTRKTVEELEKLSGYEKFDNFILTLIKMKRDMADQLEKEKAEFENEREASVAAAGEAKAQEGQEQEPK